MTRTRKSLSFPYYINGNRKAKYTTLSAAIPRAVHRLLLQPRTKRIEIIRRHDERLMIAVSRPLRGTGTIIVERIQHGANGAKQRSNVIRLDKILNRA